MLLLLQVAAFCQLFFLPGLLIMYLLRFRPDPLFLPPLAFSLSGVFNYVLGGGYIVSADIVPFINIGTLYQDLVIHAAEDAHLGRLGQTNRNVH